jgi:glycosyltransferase involved in cell wall biosynthesis
MKVAILTNFQDFNPGYSLTGIVTDQALMLKRHGHEVFLYVCQNYNPKHDAALEAIDVTPIRKVPFGHLKDYTSIAGFEHKELTLQTVKFLAEEFLANEIDIAFSHDWIFTGWNLPYGMAISKARNFLPGVRWFHWIHSIPSVFRDWWLFEHYGPMHRIIYPNKANRQHVAEQFRTWPEYVRCIPHIKDLRTWYEFDPETCRFIDDFPGVMHADIVQVYPASTDRLTAKRVDVTIRIFSELKAAGKTVCLVVANQWATRKNRKEELGAFEKLASGAGLEVGNEFVFTSEWEEKYVNGIPRRMLRELQLCSNLFLFPTKDESFGLVGPEAALAGNYLVLNRSMPLMWEIFGNEGMYADFGSFEHNFEPPDKNRYFRDLAMIILSRMVHNENVRLRTHVRQTYNYDSLYLNYYEPLMSESLTWAKSPSMNKQVIMDQTSEPKRAMPQSLVMAGGNKGPEK